MTNVIIADDHPLVLKGLRDYLSTVGDIVVMDAFSNGADALNGIRTLSPEVAILDISMPIKSGLEVLSAANEEKLPAKIVFLAGAPGPRDLAQAVALGAYGLLSKDSEPSVLIEVVRAAADGFRTFPDELLASRTPKPLPIENLLSRREWKVMTFAAEGLSNKEIARSLNITEGTAKLHLHHVFRKLGVRSRTALAALFLRGSDGSGGD